MAYGHAERNLAAIRLLEACTGELFGSLAQPGSGQSCWLQRAAKVSSQCLDVPTPDVSGHGHDHDVGKDSLMTRSEVAR